MDRPQVDLVIKMPDDNSIKLQGILVEVDEAYTHSPRTFTFAELWNVENVQRRQEVLRRRYGRARK